MLRPQTCSLARRQSRFKREQTIGQANAAAAAAGVLERILFFVSAQPDLRTSCRLPAPAAGRSVRRGASGNGSRMRPQRPGHSRAEETSFRSAPRSRDRLPVPRRKPVDTSRTGGDAGECALRLGLIGISMRKTYASERAEQGGSTAIAQHTIRLSRRRTRREGIRRLADPLDQLQRVGATTFQIVRLLNSRLCRPSRLSPPAARDGAANFCEATDGVVPVPRPVAPQAAVAVIPDKRQSLTTDFRSIRGAVYRWRLRKSSRSCSASRYGVSRRRWSAVIQNP